MIISDEQARLAAQYRAACPAARTWSRTPVSPELMARVFDIVDHAPEIRSDRVAEARSRLVAGGPDCHDVACKMISRIVSDSLR